MPHSTTLVTTIVAALALAFVLGTLAHRFRVSPLVGYLLAGVLVGPFTPGFVADQGLASELAEIGKSAHRLPRTPSTMKIRLGTAVTPVTPSSARLRACTAYLRALSGRACM